jgi:hypothetical protein
LDVTLLLIKLFVLNKEVCGMQHKAEQRRSFRMPFNTEVICHVNENVFRGKTSDLSGSGVFMETTECPPIGSKCKIEIVLNGDHSRLTIDKLSGIAKRCDERGVGIEFDDRLEWLALVPIYFHKLQEQLTG